jgi:hypothetical protein
LFQLRGTAVYNVVKKIYMFLNPHKTVSQKMKKKLLQGVSQIHDIAVVHVL